MEPDSDYTKSRPPTSKWHSFFRDETYLAFLIGGASLAVNADTWEMPRPAKFRSASQRYILDVYPSDRTAAQKGCRAVLSETRPGGDPTELCRVALTNDVSPVSALVSDDGHYFITFDEWHRVGGGNAVVAFYGRGGLLRHYSLEELVGMQDDLGWDSLFPHTVSSRWWREHSIMLFGDNRQTGRFGIWLDWAPRWLVWNLADGRQVKETTAITADWNERGAAWAQSRFGMASGIEEKITACRYAAYSRRPQDRDLLNRALADGSQDQNQRQSVRLNADRALAIWDGEAKDFSGLDYEVPERHYLLGSIEIRLRLPGPATEGQVYLMLFPEAVKASDWKHAPAEFRGGRSFRALYGQPESRNEIEFRINPARPGRYWLKAVWDRKPPFSYDLWSFDGFHAWLASTNNAIVFGPGDAESGAREMLEIKAKQSVSAVLECRTIN